MQSQGSTSSQPSLDSLSSSDSLLFSDSEPAEDDVFLTEGGIIMGGVGGGGAAPAPAERAASSRASESPGSQWACDGFADKEEDEEEQCRRRRNGGGKATRAAGESSGLVQKSEGDLVFAQKCAELQGFVRPLLELLNGLKKGRFDRGLSSFQQSVAMDRIQRIVGVLRRPNSGEKYLNTLLQVEMMLKLWFPQIQSLPVSSASTAESSPARSPQESSTPVTPPHKHRDQLHIPVKKRKLSWTGTDSPSMSPALLKCPGEKRARLDEGQKNSPASGSKQNLPEAEKTSPDAELKDGEAADPETASKYKAGQSSEPSLTWVHVAPILSPGKKACPSHEGPASGGENLQAVSVVRPPSRRGSPATQDCSVTSTTPHKHPRNLKKSGRCQSLAAQPRESDQTCQAQEQPKVTLKPLSRVCPASLET